MRSRKVLIDAIMLVTINLKPFEGKISMDHYQFNPCKYTNVYKQQLFGNYNDTFEGFSHEIFQTFFTTCLDVKEGEIPDNYMANCTNLVSLVGSLMPINAKVNFRKADRCIESMQMQTPVSTTFQNG